MGREKRVAESRAKEIVEKAKQPGEVRLDAPAAGGAAAPGVPEATVRHTGTARAILQIVLLFLIPTLVVIIIGKLIFRL